MAVLGKVQKNPGRSRSQRKVGEQFNNFIINCNVLWISVLRQLHRSCMNRNDWKSRRISICRDWSPCVVCELDTGQMLLWSSWQCWVVWILRTVFVSILLRHLRIIWHHSLCLSEASLRGLWVDFSGFQQIVRSRRLWMGLIRIQTVSWTPSRSANAYAWTVLTVARWRFCGH